MSNEELGISLYQFPFVGEIVGDGFPVPRSAQREPPLEGRWAAAKRLGGVFWVNLQHFHPSVSLLKLTAPLKGEPLAQYRNCPRNGNLSIRSEVARRDCRFFAAVP